jgi:predicted ATP-binding protein involved in virulence
MTEYLKAVKEIMSRLGAKIDANQAQMDAVHEEMMAQIRAWRKEMKAGQETTAGRVECKEPS